MNTSPLPQPTAASLQRRAEDAAKLLKALANADRLLLLCQLVGAERSVGELGALTQIAQPSLSQQLAVLRAEGLVDARRDGKRIHYRLASPAVVAVLQTLYEEFCADAAPPPAPPADPGPRPRGRLRPEA